MGQGNTVAEDEFEALDFRLIVQKVWDRRWLVLTSTSVVSAAFAAAAFLMTPIYRAEVLMVPAAQERGQGSLSGGLEQFGGLAALAGINISSGDLETEEALAVLASREFGEQFILDHELVQRFFPKGWDAVEGRWSIPENKRPTPARAFRFFDREVRDVLRDAKSGLVTLRVNWKDRIEAAEWANDLVGRLNSEMRERAIARANASLRYLDEQLETVSTVETRQAISRLMESQINRRMLANVSQEYALRVIDRALPADLDDPVRPRKIVLVAVGVVLGLFFGVGGALICPRPFVIRGRASARPV